jgi:AraC-like DNA-binding protein
MAHDVGAEAVPSSALLTFSDPDEYHSYAKTIGAGVKPTLLTPGDYHVAVASIHLEQMHVSRNEVSLPRLLHNAYPDRYHTLGFYIDDEHPPSLVNGQVVASDNIIVAPSGAEAFSRSTTSLASASLCLPPERLAAAAKALLGYELNLGSSLRFTRLPMALLLRLRGLLQAACNLAETVPDILTHPEVARAMERQLTRVMLECLATGLDGKHGIAVQNPIRVMRRFQEVLEAKPDQPIYLTDVCAEIGVADRTLRLHCMQHLGISPQRYLWLRRMNLARFALISADPKTRTVTDIATNYGFGELGRFSVQYRQLFGESPSETLRRTPDDQRPIAAWPARLLTSSTPIGSSALGPTPAGQLRS